MAAYMDYLARRIGYPGYEAYLRSEHWKVFSGGMKGSKCHCCGYREKLNVHHITYERLGEELPCDVVTVCDRCHVEIHGMAKSGHSLERAHIALRKIIDEKRERRDKGGCRSRNRWVELRELLNRSKRQTIGELREFLASKGLLDADGKPSERAYQLGFVRNQDDGLARWHLAKYIHMMQADKKVSKILRQGRQPHRLQFDRALC